MLLPMLENNLDHFKNSLMIGKTSPGQKKKKNAKPNFLTESTLWYNWSLQPFLGWGRVSISSF